MSEDKKAENHRNWLQRVQEQSWEPEILISGIVLFALFQIPPYIEQANAYLNVNSGQLFSGGNVDETLAAILLAANYWLIIGFSIHLIGRSIWAAFVGLSYVYIDGVRVDRLKYPENFKRVIAKSSNYKNLIIKLEKFCSTVFAASFLVFMCVVGVFVFIGWIGVAAFAYLELGGELNMIDKYADPFLQVLGIVYLIDFIGLGIVKRIPLINKIYFPFYRVMSFLSLSPLYRSIYYGFVTNHKWWKVTIAMLIFCFGTLVMVWAIREKADLLSTTELTINYGEDYVAALNYANLAEGKPSKRLIFESDIIERNVAKVMIVHSSEYEEEYILKQCNYEAAMEMEEVAYDSLMMACLKSFILLELDGQYIHPDYFYTEDRILERSGLLTYLDLSEYSRGMHELKLYYLLDQADEGIDTLMVADVEFFKDALPVDVSIGTARDSLKGSTN
ncbi:hypothetical protein O3Q51_12590 [Cryomorphaceae bacterium 1068]|nr:hypothetical protein [Cryomorphaceae bacterium 1068]